MHPTQIANTNSRLAKNPRSPATIIAAVPALKTNSSEIIVDITNPMRAANILGALSIGLNGKFKPLLSLELR